MLPSGLWRIETGAACRKHDALGGLHPPRDTFRCEHDPGDRAVPPVKFRFITLLRVKLPTTSPAPTSSLTACLRGAS